jgi:hypothetical protein
MSVACPSFFAALSSGLCRTVDHYCERTSDAWLAEPINALTNLAFLVAGWAAWRLFSRHSALSEDRLLAVVIFVIPVVGLGSFLFHTIATRWAEWGDVIPILIFMLLYLWLAMTRFFDWPLWLKLAIFSTFFFATFGLEAVVPGRVLWGGAMYLPTVAAFLFLGVASARWTGRVQKTFLLAVAVFMLAFTFRTLDTPLCAYLPIGTHFMWHLLNAALLYLLVRAMTLHGSRVGLAVASAK